MKRLITFALAAGLLVLSISCYGTPSTTTNTTPTTGNSVSIANLSFSPSTLSVAVGTTVTWTNNDNVVHTVTSDTGVFNSPDLSPGQTFTYTFNTTGSFAYHCSKHTYMKGTVTAK